jgi:hypothetical protein
MLVHSFFSGCALPTPTLRVFSLSIARRYKCAAPRLYLRPHVHITDDALLSAPFFLKEGVRLCNPLVHQQLLSRSARPQGDRRRERERERCPAARTSARRRHCCRRGSSTARGAPGAGWTRSTRPRRGSPTSTSSTFGSSASQPVRRVFFPLSLTRISSVFFGTLARHVLARRVDRHPILCASLLRHGPSC